MHWQEQYKRIQEFEERTARIREKETPAQRRVRDIADPDRVLRPDHLGMRVGELIQTGEIPLSLVRQSSKEILAATAHLFKDPHQDPPGPE